MESAPRSSISGGRCRSACDSGRGKACGTGSRSDLLVKEKHCKSEVVTVETNVVTVLCRVQFVI